MPRHTPIIALAAVILLAGCAQSSIGLFESIELERKIVDDRELANDLVVGAIAEAGGRYFIAAANLWQREVVDADYPAGVVAQWVRITSPGTSNYTSSSIVTFNGSGTDMLYAVFSSQDGSTAAVYEIDPAGSLSAVSDDSDVLETDSTDIAGIGELFTAFDGISEYLLVGIRAHETSRFALHGSTSGAVDSFALIPGTTGNLPIIDVAASAAGDIALLTEKAIMVDSDGGLEGGADPLDVTANLDLSDPEDPAGPARQPEFGGIHFDESSGTLWLSDNEGFLYRSTDFGLTWALNPAAHQVSTNDDSPLAFTDLASVENGSSTLVVVGTEGHGYRELDSAFAPTTPAAEGSNYQASELARATVLTFYVDPSSSAYVPTADGENYTPEDGDLLFAGTSNLGLWKALYTGDPVQWVRE